MQALPLVQVISTQCRYQSSLTALSYTQHGSTEGGWCLSAVPLTALTPSGYTHVIEPEKPLPRPHGQHDRPSTCIPSLAEAKFEVQYTCTLYTDDTLGNKRNRWSDRLIVRLRHQRPARYGRRGQTRQRYIFTSICQHLILPIQVRAVYIHYRQTLLFYLLHPDMYTNILTYHLILCYNNVPLDQILLPHGC